jgi:hypothetical protein
MAQHEKRGEALASVARGVARNVDHPAYSCRVACLAGPEKPPFFGESHRREDGEEMGMGRGKRRTARPRDTQYDTGGRKDTNYIDKEGNLLVLHRHKTWRKSGTKRVPVTPEIREVLDRCAEFHVSGKSVRFSIRSATPPTGSYQVPLSGICEAFEHGENRRRTIRTTSAAP